MFNVFLSPHLYVKIHYTLYIRTNCDMNDEISYRIEYVVYKDLFQNL